VERLVMLFSGTKKIGDCLSFGNLRNVVGLAAAGGRGSVEGEQEKEGKQGE
jgi:lysyl-tRNA synthetase class 2